MPAKVKLSDIVEEIAMQFDEAQSFLNKETGELYRIGDEELGAAEDEQSIEDFPEWQQENIKIAGEILETDKYISLPDKYEVNMYEIMERFCLSIKEDRLCERMCRAIRGSGAFRRFKDNIRRFDIEDDWYKFQDTALKEIAIEWCEENRIEFVDG
ncbi:MAG: UPF0158 family protein [Gemmatimonadota bacterium]|nr:UPF0158 family protein [Gemmatimonadota bacterium]